MLRYLQQISAFAFYVLGSTFFVAYVMLRNRLFDPLPAQWMQIADMPLAFAAILYGGLSFYLSFQPRNRTKSIALAAAIGFPLAALFALLTYLKFGMS